MRHALFLPLVILSQAAPAAGKTEGPQAQVQRLMRLSPVELRTLQSPWALAGGHVMAPYWEALAEVAKAGLAPTPKEVEALLDAAENRLVQRKDADCLALRGVIWGMRIGLHPMSAMTFAPKAGACFAEARQTDPANPRVRLFEAIHTLNTPSFFGGGPKAALPMLKEAVECAAREAPSDDPWAPAWGKAETLAWQAQALLQAKQIEAAKAAIQKSLELDPHWEFARGIQAKLP